MAPDPPSELPDLIAEPASERSRAARLALLIAGFTLIALGVVFWLLPIVTGIPFYIAGFAALGVASPRARAIINRLEKRLPRRARLVLRRRSR